MLTTGMPARSAFWAIGVSGPPVLRQDHQRIRLLADERLYLLGLGGGVVSAFGAALSFDVPAYRPRPAFAFLEIARASRGRHAGDAEPTLMCTVLTDAARSVALRGRVRGAAPSCASVVPDASATAGTRDRRVRSIESRLMCSSFSSSFVS